MTEPQEVLVLNPGSATIKWARYESIDNDVASEVGHTSVEKLKTMVRNLTEQSHCHRFIVRFVHGGSDYVQPTPVTEFSLKRLSVLEKLAPIHNHNSLLCIRLLLEAHSSPTVIAVFDTAFFRDLPKVAQSYGLPNELTEKYHLRRFGFHGFAHQGMAAAWAQVSDQACGRLVTMQLGSGCSMAAVLNGKPVDTTMGFTPNEGLLMSTRSGDVDPGLLTWLQRREGWSPDETDRVLNQDSGWLGVSGESKNMADLLKSESEDAQLAIDLFCFRVRKTLGAYYAVLGGLDGIVMSGGIAEHSATLRGRLLDGLEHLGIRIDHRRNESTVNEERISTDESAVSCMVVPGREEYQMLKASRELLGGNRAGQDSN